MSRLVIRRPSPAMIVALLALFVALGGGAYAATQINGKLIKKNSMPGNRVNKKTFVPKANFATNANHANSANSANSATNAGHANNADSATNAGHATNADNATNAGHATNADKATNATTASNSTNLGGQPPSAFLPSSVVRRINATLNAGTTGQTLVSNGPLSVTADCTKPATTITVTINDVSSAANWLDFGSLQPAASTVTNTSRSDGGSGNESGTVTRIDQVLADGTALHGQITMAVNYPSAGQCFVDGWATTA